MSLWGVETGVRTGTVYVSAEEFLDALPVDSTIELPESGDFSIECEWASAGLFQPTITWEGDASGFVIPVTETVRFGWRWVVTVLFGALLVTAGETLGWLSVLSSVSSLALTVLGGGILATTYAIAARCECLGQELLSTSSRRNKLLGEAIVGGVSLLVALAGTNLVSVVTAATLLGVVLLTVHRGTGGAFDWLTDSLKQQLPFLPRVPTRHAVYSLIATVALWLSIGSVTRPTLPDPQLFAVGGVVVLVLTAALLLYVPTRRRARFHALGAAFLSGGYLFALVTTVVSESRVTGPTALQKAPISLLGIAIGLALLWWSLWWLDIVNPRRIQEEFRAEGRQVTTRTAALFAYLSIVGTGVLVLSAIVFGLVHWQAVAGGITVWFGLVTVAFSLPLLYFAAGSVYQLRNVLHLIRRFNRYAETVDPDQLPVTAAYPVMRIPTEALYPQATVERSQETQTGDEGEREGMLFAAAYTDPFTRAIILTEYTFKTLSDEELAAVIAHEESHFRYRGAQLQFLFATVPAFVLLGKNVVYSIYDFFQRELTADQHAYVVLSTRNQMTPVESLRDVLKRFSREALTFDESGLSFLPTMLSVPERKRVGRRLEQWFDLFYGNFAGDVHPDMETRLHAINHSETIPLEMASDPEERVGLILEELESEDEDRTPD